MSDNQRDQSRGGQSRGRRDRRGQYEDNSYENDDNYREGGNRRGRGGRNDEDFDDLQQSVDSADRDNQVTERNPTSNRNQ